MTDNKTTVASSWATLIDLIEAYAEARHTHGDYTYNATTRAARDALVATIAPTEAQPVTMTGVVAPLVPDDHRIIPLATLNAWRSAVNETAARSIKAERWSYGAALKQSIADFIVNTPEVDIGKPTSGVAAPAGMPEPVAWIAEYGGDVYTAEQVQAALDADSQPKAALPLTPISNFAAAAAFASEPFTDDTFAAFQQGIRFAERVHGVSNGAE